MNQDKELTQAEIEAYDSAEEALLAERSPIERAKSQALFDYIDGKGLDANPYKRGTFEHGAYAWQMHIEQNKELTNIRGEK